MSDTKAEIQCMQDLQEYRAHERGRHASGRDFVTHTIALGNYLIAWKAQLPHGEFMPFLKQYTATSPRRAQEYMRCAKRANEMGKSAVSALLNRDPTITALMTYGKESTQKQRSKGNNYEAPEEAGEQPPEEPEEVIGELVDEDEIEEDQESEEVEVTAEDVMSTAAKDIESFCRHILKEWKESLPEDPWLDHKGLAHSAAGAIRSALKTVRLAKCSDLCPKCNWDAKCKTCLGTGRIPKVELNQLG